MCKILKPSIDFSNGILGQFVVCTKVNKKGYSYRCHERGIRGEDFIVGLITKVTPKEIECSSNIPDEYDKEHVDVFIIENHEVYHPYNIENDRDYWIKIEPINIASLDSFTPDNTEFSLISGNNEEQQCSKIVREKWIESCIPLRGTILITETYSRYQEDGINTVCYYEKIQDIQDILNKIPSKQDTRNINKGLNVIIRVPKVTRDIQILKELEKQASPDRLIYVELKRRKGID